MTDFKDQMKTRKRILLEKDFISQQLKGVKGTILENNLTEDAFRLFEDTRKTRPELARKIEQAIVKAAQAGELKERIDIERMKIILQKANTGDFEI